MKKQCKKVGIGFITGRKNFRQVLSTYLNSWSNGIMHTGESMELSLFVAYDLEYNNTRSEDYTDIHIELKAMLKSIFFIDRATVKAEAKGLQEKGVLTKAEAALLFEKGYAGKRNAILYMAAKQGMDAILFLDDDEYPLAVQTGDDGESWTGQQVLATHLKYIETAAITCGHHCGYISTIPSLVFDEVLTEDDFRLFIEAISNDIIGWDALQALMKNGNISFAQEEVLAGGAVETPQKGNAKFITGSNLCINLKDLGALSPFYNPPSARGEDTFLSTCLAQNRVVRVPCYTFHDGFLLYTALLKGVLPPKLRPAAANSQKVMQRFYTACLGWVRYKPLLLYITNRASYASEIAKMKESFEKTLPKLSAYFQNPRFLQLAGELNKYDTLVEQHYAAFQSTRQAWQKLAAYLDAIS